jgi:hypothetical protein
MGCISLWVGLGLARMESESDAVRRSGVWALGLKDPWGGEVVSDAKPLWDITAAMMRGGCRAAVVAPQALKLLKTRACRSVADSIEDSMNETDSN